MRFGKRYSQMTVFMAMIHGVVLGILAIIVVGFVFVGTEGSRSMKEIEKEIPTVGPENKEDGEAENEGLGSLTLYAKQHGAFTNSASAATFIEEDSSLSTAAIIQVESQYFVWSAVGKTDAEIESMLDENTFNKAFTVEPLACVEQVEKLWEVFKSEDVAKIKNSISKNDDEKIEEFIKKMDTITSFTDDLSVIRLHLLSAYLDEQACVKISF